MRTKDTEMSKTMIESKMMIEKRKCGERERKREREREREQQMILAATASCVEQVMNLND